MRGVVMLVQKFGISSCTQTKIWKKFGTSAEGEFSKESLSAHGSRCGAGFKTCDSIALRLALIPVPNFA